MSPFSRAPSSSHDQLEKEMSNCTDAQLHSVLYSRSGDYTTEAIEVAREEFHRRDLDDSISEHPYPGVNDIGRDTPRKPSIYLTILERLMMLAAVVWLIWAGWGYVKRAGLINQTRITDVYFDGNWLTGEYRPCQTDGNANHLSCPKYGESERSLELGAWVPRSFSVDFYGNIAGSPEDIFKWQCKRETDSFTCHSTQ